MLELLEWEINRISLQDTVRVWRSDLEFGNNVHPGRLAELSDEEKYPDSYLLNHPIINVARVFPNVVVFKIQDGNHALAEYMRRYPNKDPLELPRDIFQVPDSILEKYEECCL